MSEKDFRFWMPIDDIQKATDDKGKEVMKFAGFASTNKKDTDQETLQSSGFDISYLKERGVVNYNHVKNDPNFVIGEPTKVELRPEGLWLEATLYPDSELAKGVYKLGQTMQKNSKNRRLGFSIEGRAVERDPANPLNVVKAFISGVAITPSPKNSDSFIDIVKGHISDVEETPVSDRDPLKEVETLIKAFTPASERAALKENLEKALEEEGIDEIVAAEEALEKAEIADVAAHESTEDIEKGKDTVEKALMAGDTTGRDTANVSSPGSGAALKTESVQTKLKKTKDAFDDDDDEPTGSVMDVSKGEVETVSPAGKKSKKQEDIDVLAEINEQNKKIEKSNEPEVPEVDTLTKSEVYEKIFRELPGIGFEKAEKIFHTINNLAMSASKNKTSVSNDLLEKALAGLKGETATPETEEENLIKGEEDETVVDLDELEKGEDDDTVEEEDEIEKGEEEEIEEEDDDLNKGIETKTLDVPFNDDLQKSIDGLDSRTSNGFKNISIVLKGMYENQMTQQNLIKGLIERLESSEGNIQKSITDTLAGETEGLKDIIVKGQETIQSMIEEFGNAAPAPKSITNSKQIQTRNFNQPSELTKGLVNEGDDLSKAISLSKHKKQIVAKLDKYTFEKGFNAEMADAMTLFESGDILKPAARHRLESEGFKIVA